MPINRPKRRSLILAGGGLKVAFQAGVLQVWLDEAGLDFDHADGVSGGAFNLAMYCQGMSGTQIADNWRTLNPRLSIDPNWRQWPRLLYAESLMRLDRFRDNVFPHWGLDWQAIRSSSEEATFNVYNFSKHELEVLSPDQMTPEMLVACTSLPMWFPPVRIGDKVYIDPVYITGANLEEAIRRGADELWVIWTTGERGEWNDGFVNNYFQVIETAANGHFKRVLRRIEESNAALSEGRPAEFGRPVDVKLLRAEVPIHYILNLSRRRLQASVELGVVAGRSWCRERGIPLTAPSRPLVEDPTALRFTQEMKGAVSFGVADPDRGYREGRAREMSLTLHLTIDIQGVNRFITDPRHESPARGYIDCEALGGHLAVEEGTFNLLTDEGDPTQKQMLYRLPFHDGAGHALTLSGFKRVRDDPGADAWSDTTTLYTRVLQGHVAPTDERTAQVVAAGIVKLGPLDFLRQLSTFRATAPTVRERASALASFGQAFCGNLWDVYARRLLPYAPL